MRWLLVCKFEDLPDPSKPETWRAPTAEEENNFYAHLGATVATWQFVEEALFTLFAEVLQQHSSRPLSAAFYSVPGFRGRLSMVNAAIEQSALSDSDKDEWKVIHDRAVKKSKRRNTITHSVVVFEPESSCKGDRIYLRPSPIDALRSELRAFPTPSKDKVGIKELVEAMQSFEDLRVRLFTFFQQVQQQRTPPPASPE